jgi:hypothetical protein
MDVIFLGITLLVFALSYGLIHLSEQLRSS